MLQVSEVVSGNCKLKNRVQFHIRVGAILVEVNLIFFSPFSSVAVLQKDILRRRQTSREIATLLVRQFTQRYLAHHLRCR